MMDFQQPKGGVVRRVAAIAAVAVVFAAAAWGQAPPASPPPSQGSGPSDLGTGALDPQVERELFGTDPRAPEPKKPPAPDPAATRRANAWNDLLERELGQAAADEVQNPLLGIARSMRLAEGLIDENESGDKTQRIQAEIVADIDTLLERAQKKCQSCMAQSQRQSAGQQKPPNEAGPPKPQENTPDPKPTTASNAEPKKAEEKAPNMAEMLAVIKQVWGELPEQQRQRMLQSSIEEFLPKYADMIEQYFKRLAEDKKEPR